jgi:hypothetical protein
MNDDRMTAFTGGDGGTYIAANMSVEDIAVAPAADATRQLVLDVAGEYPDYNWAEIGEVLTERGTPVIATQVIGAMKGL